MKKLYFLSVAFAFYFLFCVSYAQESVPKLAYIYPASISKGGTTLVIVGGMTLGKISGAYLSSDDVKVKSIKFFKPFDKFSNDLGRELMPMLEAIDKGEDPVAAAKQSAEKILSRIKKNAEKDTSAKDSDKQGKKDKDGYEEMLKIVPGERLIYIDKTPEEVVEIIKKLSPLEYQCLCKAVFTQPNALQANPALQQNIILEIEIADTAKTGLAEIRLYSKEGASNPLSFEINDLPVETEPFYTREDKKIKKKIPKFPCILNGEIMPGEIDRFNFDGKKGQKYSFAVLGRKFIPYIGDAVPGWFQPVISIHNDKGDVLAFADDNMFDPDPLIEFTAPADAKYELKIHDSIYRGREDFVYRIKATTGNPTEKYKFQKPNSSLSVIAEKEENNALRNSQKIQIPVMIEGIIGDENDADFYSFDTAKGSKTAIEVFARRQNSPLDSVIQIFDSGGKMIMWNDDWNWPNIGINTHHSDSYVLFEAPKDGTYTVKIYNAGGKGGKEYAYALRIDGMRPDFDAYASPSVLNARSGEAVSFKINIFRKDGFSGPVEIKCSKGPPGITINGGKISAGAEEMKMTAFIPKDIKEGFYEIELTADAKIANHDRSKKVISADDVMQAFLYRHLVPVEKLLLYVSRRTWLPFVDFPKEFSIKAGEEKKLFFKCAPWFKPQNDREVIFELDSPPDGLSVVESGFDKEQLSGFATIRAGTEMKNWNENIVLNMFSRNTKEAKTRRNFVGCLPAIPAHGDNATK